MHCSILQALAFAFTLLIQCTLAPPPPTGQPVASPEMRTASGHPPRPTFPAASPKHDPEYVKVVNYPFGGYPGSFTMFQRSCNWFLNPEPYVMIAFQPDAANNPKYWLAFQYSGTTEQSTLPDEKTIVHKLKEPKEAAEALKKLGTNYRDSKILENARIKIAYKIQDAYQFGFEGSYLMQKEDADEIWRFYTAPEEEWTTFQITMVAGSVILGAGIVSTIGWKYRQPIWSMIKGAGYLVAYDAFRSGRRWFFDEKPVDLQSSVRPMGYLPQRYN